MAIEIVPTTKSVVGLILEATIRAIPKIKQAKIITTSVLFMGLHPSLDTMLLDLIYRYRQI